MRSITTSISQSRAPALTRMSSRFCGQFEEMIQFHSHDPERAAVRLWDLLHQMWREPTGSRPQEALHPHLQIALSMIRSPAI